MKLPLRVRFALLAAALVLLVASLVGLGGYLTFQSSLLGRASSTATAEATRLAGLVTGAGQSVDVTDASLTRQLATPGLRVSVVGPNGAVLQSTAAPGGAGALPLNATFRHRCLTAGQAHTRLSNPALSVACVRVGSARTPIGTIAAGVPLQDSLASLASLRRSLILGVLGGVVLAAVLSLLLAGRALRPLKRIARTAETIRSGDLGQRIAYGSHDEVGQLADVLDACFAELEQAIDRQRRFAADASHELKTPLAAIRANLEVLLGWAALDPGSRETALASMDQAARRASRLVADLLQLVRLDREPPRPRMPTRLDDVVLGAVREAAPLRRDVAISVSRLDDVTISGDPMGLQQLLVNVLDNALRVSPAGGEVSVALSATRDRATVTVTDAGPGIDPGELEPIFDRFYTRTVGDQPHAGSGLGLAIARPIAREHGGDLSARNQPGAGATFTLTLPLPVASVRPNGEGQAAGSLTTKRAPASLG